MLDGALIFHIREEKSGGGGGGGTAGEVAGGDNLGELLGGNLTPADIDQSAHNGAHHIPQKAVGAEDEYQHTALYFNPFRTEDVANIARIITAELRKGGEVLGRQQMFGCLIHRLDVEWGGELPRGGSREGVFAGVDIVAVLPLGGVEPCVGIVCDGVDAREGNILGQERIEVIDKALGIVDGFRGVEMEHIEGCVDTRVGSAGTHNLHTLTQDGRESLLDGLLYRAGVGLALPTTIGGTLIGKFGKVTHNN